MAKKDRIDKAKYSGKVTNTEIKREKNEKSLKGIELKLTEKSENHISTYYGNLVEG